MTEEHCLLCRRRAHDLTRHHLFPRTLHTRLKKQGRHADRDLGEVVTLCRSCHKQVHALHSEKELAEFYNTAAALLADPELMQFADWISTKDNHFTARVQKRKRNR